MADNNVGSIYEVIGDGLSDNILSYRLRQFGARGD